MPSKLNQFKKIFFLFSLALYLWETKGADPSSMTLHAEWIVNMKRYLRIKTEANSSSSR